MSYGNIITNEKFKHLRVPNLYQSKRVCQNCHDALSKIDKNRQFALKLKKGNRGQQVVDEGVHGGDGSATVRYKESHTKLITASDSHLPVKLKNLKEINKVVSSAIIFRDRTKTSRKIKRHSSQAEF